MSKTYSRIWVHLLFSTQHCRPLISRTIESQVFAHLRAQLIELGCPVKLINGMPDHVHLLFRLTHKTALMDIVKQIKGNSSHWINEHNLTETKFVWQKGFNAFAVGDAQVKEALDHIRNQKNLHLKKTFLQELDELIAMQSTDNACEPDASILLI